MELDRLAQRVLVGTTLADKLTPWPEIGPAGTGASVPVEPGRPPELALRTGHRGASLKGADLRSDAGRARVLHELANHELQAIEVLALALLRWPDAPAGFRRGLVATLGDEQRHCQLYLDRLQSCGGTLGEQPVSRFFWDSLSRVDTPAQFVAGLSLCFEAANLDFCLDWAGRFSRAGDEQTAAVLHAVYEDEIRHVAHGLVWFGRWAKGERVDAWRAALPHPLTPARSRGPRFDRVGRRRAGFSEDELDILRVMGGSRGRPGRVLWFDAGIEDVLATGSRSAMAQRVNRDLATLPMFLVRTEDVVVAPQPSARFLGRLADVGFEVPRFVPSLAELGPHPVEQLQPWGLCPAPLHRGEVRSLRPAQPWDPAWAALSSKTETCRRAMRLPAHPCLVEQRGEVWTEIGDPGPGPWVIKAPLSASGTRRIRGEGPLNEKHRAWLGRQLREAGEVLWQPWYMRLADVSVHLEVDDTVQIDGITRFSTGPGGQFEGTLLGHWVHGLPGELQRAIHGGGRASEALQPVLERAATDAGEWARGLGFRGPLSIDAALVRTASGVRVHPWLETNARLTLGRVGLALRKRIHPRAQGSWRVERWSEARARFLMDAQPPTLRDGRLFRGLLPTTDPETAHSLLTWIEVAAT